MSNPGGDRKLETPQPSCYRPKAERQPANQRPVEEILKEREEQDRACSQPVQPGDTLQDVQAINRIHMLENTFECSQEQPPQPDSAWNGICEVMHAKSKQDVDDRRKERGCPAHPAGIKISIVVVPVPADEDL